MRTSTEATRKARAAQRRAIDERARMVAQRCVAGAIAEPEARAELAELAWESGSWRQPVLARYPGQHSDFNLQRLCDETLENVEHLIFERILDPTSGSTYLDLEMVAAGGSLCGWIWKFAAAAVRSEERRAINAMGINRAAPADDLDDDWDGIPDDGAGPEEQSIAGPGITDDDADALISDFRRQVSRTTDLSRQGASVHLRAETVCRAFGLPLPARLACRKGSSALLKLVSGDTSEPWRQARAFADGSSDAAGAQLMALYDFDRRLVAGLADLDERVALSLALSSLTPIPRVSRAAVAAVRTSLSKAGLPRDRAYRLAAAWGETQTEMSQTGVKSEDEIDADRERFESLAEKSLAAGLEGWGTTPAELARHAAEVAGVGAEPVLEVAS